MLSLLLAVPSCIYSFWHGVIPTSYFIFNDFYTCFTNFLSRLSLDCNAQRDGIARYTYTFRRTRTRMRIVPEVVTFTCGRIKWRRSKRKSPRWTWILLSEGQTLPYYTKGTSRTKIRPSHIKIMVFRPLIWTVERLY